MRLNFLRPILARFAFRKPNPSPSRWAAAPKLADQAVRSEPGGSGADAASGRRPLTAVEIEARRRNGRRSQGPVTRDGKRRSSLNTRRLSPHGSARKILKKLGAEPCEFERVWRDVLMVFGFMGPEMEAYLPSMAWDWWLKLHHIERGSAGPVCRAINVRLEKKLVRTLEAYRVANRKWWYRLRTAFGIGLEAGPRDLRLAVEGRLPSYRELAARTPMAPTEFDPRVNYWAKIAKELQNLQQGER